jgi:two-component sensor histidine kinase
MTLESGETCAVARSSPKRGPARSRRARHGKPLFYDRRAGYPDLVTKTTTYLELALPAVPASVRRARIRVAETVTSIAETDRVVDDVMLCVSEAVTNAVRHGYGAAGKGTIEIVVVRVDGELEVVVRDSGVGFDKAEKGESTGGFGLGIIAKLAKRHNVKSTPEGTEISMAFELGRGARSLGSWA